MKTTKTYKNVSIEICVGEATSRVVGRDGVIYHTYPAEIKYSPRQEDTYLEPLRGLVEKYDLCAESREIAIANAVTYATDLVRHLWKAEDDRRMPSEEYGEKYPDGHSYTPEEYGE